MDIINNRLVDDAGDEHYTAGNYVGPIIVPKYVIIHATATASPFDRNVGAFTIPSYKASIHLLMGRGGEFHQFVPFNAAAGHCGANHWDSVGHSMDLHSIGIELLNAGPLDSDGQGGYYKRTFHVDYTIPENDRELVNNRWWQSFPDAQIETALTVVKLLFQTYQGLRDVLKHSEINTSGLRENCPGPAFPMQRFHANVLGLDENLPITRVHITNRYSHLYTGPGEENDRVLSEGLPRNIDLGVLHEENGWSYVHVFRYPAENLLLTGWIQNHRINVDGNKPRHYHKPPEIIIPGTEPVNHGNPPDMQPDGDF
jgi:N-acetylmuramoyl-L-alanine amidase